MPKGSNPTYVAGSEPRPLPTKTTTFATPPRVIPTGLNWDALRSDKEQQA